MTAASGGLSLVVGWGGGGRWNPAPAGRILLLSYDLILKRKELLLSKIQDLNFPLSYEKLASEVLVEFNLNN